MSSPTLDRPLSLYLFRELNRIVPFDRQRVRACLHAMPGISDWREGADPPLNNVDFQCVYHRTNQSTLIAMLKEQDAFVWIQESNGAALHAAFEFQKCYGEPIVVTLNGDTPTELPTYSTVWRMKRRLFS